MVEKDLVKPVINWLGNSGFSVKREFQTAWGICDIVAAKPYKSHIMQRKIYSQLKPLNSARKIDILNIVPDRISGKTISFNSIIKEIGNPSNRELIVRDFVELERDNFIVRTKTCHYQKMNGWMPIHKQVLAIELKMNRVSEAIFQAKNNQKFTAQSYVALPIETVDRVINIGKAKLFCEAGVGLIGVQSRDCTIIIKPQAFSSANDMTIQSLYIERFWKNWLKGNLA